MDENIKSSYYSILPAVVRYDKDLTDKAKLLYSESRVCVIKKDIVLLQIIILLIYIIALLEQYNLQYLSYKKKAI